MSAYPVLVHTAIDATNCRGLAEFYRQFLGLRYRPGDEIPADGSDDDPGWLVLPDPAGRRVFAFQDVLCGAHHTPARAVARDRVGDLAACDPEPLSRCVTIAGRCSRAGSADRRGLQMPYRLREGRAEPGVRRAPRRYKRPALSSAGRCRAPWRW